ncbi:expressed unknown protein [Seminavis robusta]|uniref:Uncharacterized protein n=1 Tax=Seminavis robusta TaxID=568900 RepID=A0A9N8EKB1_9STRA|nr:expressed unknown protein [Seminavis robusta]|eukprot:Sro1218_g253381.1  (105) ;mRNA; f:27764-28078
MQEALTCPPSPAVSPITPATSIMRISGRVYPGKTTYTDNKQTTNRQQKYHVPTMKSHFSSPRSLLPTVGTSLLTISVSGMSSSTVEDAIRTRGDSDKLASDTYR